MEEVNSACPQGGGPSMNTDISGTGVRISFYLQTLFLAFLCARSTSLLEITGALYTLIATNLAIAVTSLLLGLQPRPDMSLPEWVPIYNMSQNVNKSDDPGDTWTKASSQAWSGYACNRLEGGTKIVKTVSVVQSYVLFAFAFAILITTKDFGSHPECNKNAKVVLLGAFKVFNAGRIIGWIVTVILSVTYTFMTIMDYLPDTKLGRIKKVLLIRWRPPSNEPAIAEPSYTRRDQQSGRSGLPLSDKTPTLSRPIQPEVYHPSFSGKLVIELTVILMLWGLAVGNTEGLIKANHFEPSKPDEGSTWTFGQVLPLFLVVLPLANTINAFSKHGLKPSRIRVQTTTRIQV